MSEISFQSFGKIGRLFRDMIITEKIDGTNAAVGVTEQGVVYAQSRKRLITPATDNFGFALWVEQHEDELRELGPGLHFGEWWGVGIQRGYGMSERRFSLFNTHRWGNEFARPACCHVVPVLRTHTFDTAVVQATLDDLRENGSQAAPGFPNAEGVVVYHRAGNALFKATLDGDDHKGA